MRKELGPAGTKILTTRLEQIRRFENLELLRFEPGGRHELAGDRWGQLACRLDGPNRWVSIGINHDTAQFAANSIRRWWMEMGQSRFPKAKRLLITADAGGSNGPRLKLWKLSLRELSNDLKLDITVCHFPPGTSKWNKIEHRLFSFISQNWRGQPLYDLTTVVNLICHTTTREGLIVRCAVDDTKYEKGIKVTDAEVKAVGVKKHDFHGEWNDTIKKR